MSTMPEILSQATAAVAPIVRAAGGADPAAATPCQEWVLSELTRHALGTTAGLARLGRREPLDPDDPWGDPTTELPWSEQLSGQLEDLATAWSDPGAWEGEVDMGGQRMPASMIGDMVLAEVVLHGWDLARATGQRLELPDAVARQLRRGIEETAAMGRQMGVYGDAVEVDEDAPDFDHALAAAGRDPAWSAN
ncbi:MAG TPA: TIGR03086 family metal-binding protein [Microlunatus sp.]|nr:TIGR03086 family metal-binding protein [Microlunatus sp.]